MSKTYLAHVASVSEVEPIQDDGGGLVGSPVLVECRHSDGLPAAYWVCDVDVAPYVGSAVRVSVEVVA